MGLDKVTGKARFGADLALAGHARRCRHPLAPRTRAHRFDRHLKAAEAMPGVHAVITSADLPDLAEAGASDDDVFMSAEDPGPRQGLWEGHPVAAVAADDSRTGQVQRLTCQSRSPTKCFPTRSPSTKQWQPTGPRSCTRR